MKKFYFILSIAVLAFVSCNKESRMGSDVVKSDLIEFSAGEEFVMETRATEVTTASLSQIYVTAVTQTTSGYGGQTVTDNAVTNFTNVAFSKPNNSSNFSGGKVWPSSDPNYRFYATNVNSPALQNNSGGATIQVSGSSAPANDIVVGYLSSPTYKQTNQFTMQHIFCQLGTITLNAPAGYTVRNLKLYFRPMYTGTYNLRSGSWSGTSAVNSDYYAVGSSSSGVDISTAGGSYNSGDKDLWLIPGTYNMTATYQISTGDYTSPQATKTTSVTLVQGRNNNISGTLVSADVASEIVFTVTVEPWSDNNITGINF